MKKLAILLSFVAIGVACAPKAVRMGRIYPPREAACSIEFLNLAPNEVAVNYETIGALPVSGGDVYSESHKKALQKEACKLGASAVTPAISTQGSLMNKSQTMYSLLRRK